MTAVVVKGRELPTTGKATFVCGVDGSDRAHRALQLVERLKRPGDEIIIVHIDVRGEGASHGVTTDATRTLLAPRRRAHLRARRPHACVARM